MRGLPASSGIAKAAILKRFCWRFRELLRRIFRPSIQKISLTRWSYQMRRLILLGLMAAVVLPAVAAKRVTVLQLEQSLATDIASHRADAEVAHRLGDFELYER